MSMCPNKALPEWGALVAKVGEFEAYRDYLENNFEIRDVESVTTKLATRAKLELGTNPVDTRHYSQSLTDVIEATEPIAIQVDDQTSDNIKGIDMAKQLASQLGIEYQTVTRNEAISMTSQADMPYEQMEKNAREKGLPIPPGFFFAGKVYFVGENISTATAIHEFGHPLVRTILKQNPTLFNKLFQKLLGQRPDLVTSLTNQRPDLDPTSDLFKEEALVMALTDAAIKLNNGEKIESGFKNFMTDLMYAIKQLLRKVFGEKIPVSKIEPNTSIEELADILMKGGNFQVDKSAVTDAEVVSYMTEMNEYMADIEKIDGKYIHDFLNKASFLVENVEKMLQAEKYDELSQVLVDQFGRSEIRDLKSDLKTYKSTLKKIAEGIISENKNDIKTAQALAKTLTSLQTILDKTLIHMQQIADSERDSIDSMQKFFYYEKFVNHWKDFVNEINVTVRDRKKMGFRIDEKSPLLTLLKDLNGTIESIEKESNLVRADGARDALYAQLEPMGKDIKEKYEGIISKLKEANAPQSQIDKWTKEYHGMTEAEFAVFDKLRNKLRRKETLTISEEKEYGQLSLLNKNGIEISPEKIEGLLKGQLGDANWLNSYLEGYLYNNDAVIAGLALYVKNGLNDVMIKSQAKFNEFAEDLKPDLEKIGFNPSNIGELGQLVGDMDVVGKLDENGNVVETQVWTLLNRFKGYRLKETQLNDEKNKAEQAFAESNSEENRLRYLEAHRNLKKFKRDYMHDEYISEVYEAEDLLGVDQIGKEAAYQRQVALDAINSASEKMVKEDDTKEAEEEMKLALRAYRQLFSMNYLNGQPKTAEDKAIAERLTEHRKRTRQYYEWKLRKGSFEKALATYEAELELAKYPRGSEKFNMLRNAWIQKNTRRTISNEYYEKRNKLIQRKKEILSKLPDSIQKEIDNTTITETILDYTDGFRDENNEVRANELDPAVLKKVKELEEASLQKNKNYVRKSGLTPEQHAQLSRLFELKNERDLNDLEREEMFRLIKVRNDFGLNEYEMAELDSINLELEELTDYSASEYYVDIMDTLLKKVDATPLKEATGSNTVTKQTADALLDPAITDKLLGQSEEFDTWFKANHIETEYFDRVTGKKVKSYRRLRVWSASAPKDERFLETTELKDEFGNVTDVIPGIPKMEFYSRNIKKEYKTGYNAATDRVEKIIGVHINNRGEWLPKSIEDGAVDGTYINEKYEQMRNEKPDLFKVLEKLTKHHLKNQEGAAYKSKLYLDFPRFSKSRLEVFQSSNPITTLVKRIKGFFGGYADDFEDGLNSKDQWNLVKADMFDDEIASVPIRGLYDLDISDVSTDITKGMMQYMFSIETQKQLIEMSPLARSIQDVLNDPDNKVKDLEKVNKWNLVNRGIVTYLNKDGMKVRQRAVTNFIEREFEGKNLSGFGSDVPWLQNASNAMFKAASFQFFALNIPSALKNSFGAKFQSMIEAAAGKYYNVGDWTKGNAWSYKAMTDMSLPSNLYAKGAKSLTQQLIDIYDPVQGRFEEKFGDSMSRSALKDAVSGSWLYSFRKWVELQATLQIFGGMMYHKKVKIFEGTPQEKEINMIDAWETKDGKIQLKEGVNPEEGITYDSEGKIVIGKNFKAYKNKIQQVMNNLQGAYSQFDQPEAQRYLAFRYISFLRKYLTPMLINRWGHAGSIFNGTVRPRLNAGLGEGHTGYYITTLKVLKETVKEMGKNLPFMQADEKAAVLRTLTEVIGLIVLYFGANALFGYDPDDEDRYKKLRAKSGPLPLFGTDDSNEAFNPGGWAENHMLLLMMNVRAENQQFIPLPGLGLKEYASMMDLKSVAFGPTVSSYIDILDNLLKLATGDERAYYAKDAGPYRWQKEGDPKIINMFSKMIGLTGSSLSPDVAIKNLNSVQARK